MGEASRRKKQFLEDHPLCCFCGGARPSSTIDHQPARVFFANREWPEGFVFPACLECNAASKEAENALSLLLSPESEAGTPDRRNRIDWIKRHQPEIIRDILSLPTREKRKIAKELGIAREFGQAYADLPIAKFNKDIWDPYLQIFARKIMLALYYQTFSRVLPREGWMALIIESNVQIAKRGFPLLSEIAPRLVKPRRSNRYLNDQLVVRFDFASDLDVAVYVVSLHGILFFSAVVSGDPELFKRVKAPSQTIHHPLN